MLVSLSIRLCKLSERSCLRPTFCRLVCAHFLGLHNFIRGILSWFPGDFNWFQTNRFLFFLPTAFRTLSSTLYWMETNKTEATFYITAGGKCSGVRVGIKRGGSEGWGRNVGFTMRLSYCKLSLKRVDCNSLQLLKWTQCTPITVIHPAKSCNLNGTESCNTFPTLPILAANTPNWVRWWSHTNYNFWPIYSKGAYCCMCHMR